MNIYEENNEICNKRSFVDTANAHQIYQLGRYDEDMSHGPVERRDSLSDLRSPHLCHELSVIRKT